MITLICGDYRLEKNMHVRLRNELVFRLTQRALAICGRRPPSHFERGAFDECYRAFQEELDRYEADLERMESRLRGSAKSGGEPTNRSQTMFD
jgi:hypothetical protein